MKTRLLVIVGIMIIAFAAMVAPVMAGLTDTTAVYGNPTAYVSVTVSGPAALMTLAATGANSDTSMHLDAITNCPATITAVDAMSNGKGSAGYMVNVTTAGNTYSADKLGAKMQISGADAGVFTATTADDLATTPHLLYTASGATATQELALSFDQTTSYSDPRLPSGYSYRIPVTFTIGST
jgi:hypothetical protein